jgi:hypothetical protein
VSSIPPRATIWAANTVWITLTMLFVAVSAAPFSRAVSRAAVPPESAERHRDQANGAKGECSEVEIHGFGELKVPSASPADVLNASQCRLGRNNRVGPTLLAAVARGSTTRTNGPRREEPRPPGGRLRGSVAAELRKWRPGRTISPWRRLEPCSI